MGRPEKPLDPQAGPIEAFAYALRRLREEAGRPTYRELARRTRYSATALQVASRGERLPSLAVTLAFVQACGGDRQEWEQRWRAAETALAAVLEVSGITGRAAVSVVAHASRSCHMRQTRQPPHVTPVEWP
ncbi:helix-turn-helix domain-containing protein [Nonomuraea typhae]|uniref:Helix-turn-helix domain-containing protein n=1 Tax=Nonomuraea typhae TaxID=2603600 RepID=A0ABW7YVK3_9ACTN